MRSVLLTTALAAFPLSVSAATFDFGALGTAYDEDANGVEGSWDEVTELGGRHPRHLDR